MKGDFSRVSFDPRRRFSRVLMQQGRVLTDSDWNEQASIHLHLLRTLAADLIGPHGGPENGAGFEISLDSEGNDLVIGSGRYYVDGWLCENIALATGEHVLWRNQAAWEEREADIGDGPTYIAYLDVWERHISSPVVDGAHELERRHPALLRELALGGPDTASRAEVAWRVRLDEWQPAGWNGTNPPAVDETDDGKWLDWFKANLALWRASLQPRSRGSLIAMAKADDDDDGHCVIPPESRYRGLENQLYRVEIHDGGAADPNGTDGATFKWSRENGSVVLPIARIDGDRITLASWWRDARGGLGIGQFVEIGDDADATARDATSKALRRVVRVDPDEMTVTLDQAPQITVADPKLHPRLRRWDHRTRRSENGKYGMLTETNTLRIVEDRDIELEDGVRVTFRAQDPPHEYRTGDYWLIPARTAIRDVIWPLEEAGDPATGKVALLPSGLPPHGVEHHYAPLAVVNVGGANPVDLRQSFQWRTSSH
jgi:hypothetical protein